MRGTIANWLNRPEYIYQPDRLICRLVGGAQRWKGEQTVELPWGLPLEVDTSQTFGRILSHHGIWELPVVEAIFRLVDATDVVLDIGANAGYMTAAAVCAGARSVTSYEPHPVLFARLARSVERWNAEPRVAGRVIARQQAVSSAQGTATLLIPKKGVADSEIATLESELDSAAYDQVQVETATIDTIVGEMQEPIGLMKIDIEGHELQAFKGAGQTLRHRKIRDIVYEDFNGVESDATRLLMNSGYSIFGLQRSVLGLVLIENPGPGKRSFLSQNHNMLATLEPARAKDRILRNGYKCMSRAARAGF
jgi:FkbM family methyltransferase